MLYFRIRHTTIIFVHVLLTNYAVASVNLELSTTVAQRLNQSRASGALLSNLNAIKFSTAEARRLNWA